MTSGIPTTDSFSFTYAGQAVRGHEWLCELGLFALYRVGGVEAVNLAFGVLAAFAFWLVYRRAASRVHPYFAMGLTLLAALASTTIYAARPQILTLVGLAFYAWLVDRVRQRRSHAWILAGLIPLAAIWANLHAGYLAGIVLLWGYAAADYLDQRLFGSREDHLTPTLCGRLALIGALCLLAAVLNPLGPGIWTLPVHELNSGAYHRFLFEWQPPDLLSPAYILFTVLLGVGALGWVLNRKRPYLSELGLFIGAATLALLSARHVALFAVLATPIICHRLWPLLRRLPLQRSLQDDTSASLKPRSALPVVAALLLTTASAGWISIDQRLEMIADNVQNEYPIEAVEFLKRSGLDKQRGLNPYDWGGYLIWNDVPVFIDGRAATLYEPDFLMRYLRTFALEAPLLQLLSDYRIDYTLVHADHSWDRLLRDHPGWHEVYRDPIAAVMVSSSRGAAR